MINCIVIGAAKELIEQHINNIAYLASSQKLGETFFNTYDNFKLTFSAVLSMFLDYWVKIIKKIFSGQKMKFQAVIIAIK